MTCGEPSSSDREPNDAAQRASRVKLVLLDSDGVMTDGRLIWGTSGDELRAFDAKDGLGVRLGQRAGLRFGVISGRECAVVSRRTSELDMDEVHQGIQDKHACFRAIAGRMALEPDQICYMGDDLIDVPVLRAVGFAAAPADAMLEARDAAHYVTQRRGGRGAVREVIDFILKSNGTWPTVTQQFLGLNSER